MDTWICVNCQRENLEDRKICIKCGTGRISKEDYELVLKLREVIKKLNKEYEIISHKGFSKWEYLEITTDQLSPEQDLNSFGSKGWELVAVTSFTVGRELTIMGYGDGKYEVKYLYAFKRRLPSERPDELINRYLAIKKRCPSEIWEELKKLEDLAFLEEGDLIQW